MTFVMRIAMRLAVAAVLALTCQLAHANAFGTTPTALPPGLTPPATPDPEPARVESYRGQVVLADGIAVVLMFAAVDADDSDTGEALAKLSIGTYALGAPLIHLTKDRSSRALASVTMRIGFPIIGGMLGASMNTGYDCSGDVCYNDSDDEIALGILAGVIAASAVDAIYLAKGDPVKREPAWTPTARATQNGFALGVSGRF